MKAIIIIIVMCLPLLFCGCKGTDFGPVPAAPSDLWLFGSGFCGGGLSGGGTYDCPNVTIYWKDNSNNESSFQVEMKEGAGSYSSAGETISDKTEYVDFGYSKSLQANVHYTYRVCASNGSGRSAYSNEASITIVDLWTLGYIHTMQADLITSTTARCGVTIDYDGGLNIISSGVMWNEIPISMGGGGVTAHKSAPNGPGTGSFTLICQALNLLQLIMFGLMWRRPANLATVLYPLFFMEMKFLSPQIERFQLALFKEKRPAAATLKD